MITIPLIVTLTLLVVQVVLIWHARHVAQEAARAGVQAARGLQARPGAGDTRARAYLRTVAPRLLQHPEVDVRTSTTVVTVTVRAQILPVVPGLRLRVEEHSAAPVERFVALDRDPGITTNAWTATALGGAE